MALRNPVRRATALAALAAVLILLPSAPAQAHAGLLEASPDEGESLSRPPEEVRLRFNEPVRAEFDPVKVLDESGDRVDEGDARTEPGNPEVVVASLKDLPEGSYTVEWRVTSADGDPIDADYGFVVANSDVEPDEGNEGAAPVGEDAAESGGLSFGVILGVLVVGGIAVAGFMKLRGR